MASAVWGADIKRNKDTHQILFSLHIVHLWISIIRRFSFPWRLWLWPAEEVLAPPESRLLLLLLVFIRWLLFISAFSGTFLITLLQCVVPDIIHLLTLSLPSSKRTFSQHLKRKCLSDVVRIGSLIIFPLSNLLYEKPSSSYCYVIFPVGLQGKFEVKGTNVSWINSPLLTVIVLT